MTTMKPEDLIELGFNRNEARVYLSLIKFGKADAHQLIQDTKFHKNIVYDNLEKLMDKGLVTYILEEGRRVYKLASSNMLIEFFNEQEKEIKEKQNKAKEIAKEIDKISKVVKEKQEAMIYKGIKGIKSFYNETLDGKDYDVFGAPKESVDIMGELFWKNYNVKRISKKIKVKMIFNSSLKNFARGMKDKYTDVRFFDKDFEPLTETHVQEDQIAIIVWTEDPVLFIIRDKSVANNYRKFFEGMWRDSKR